MYKLMLYFWRYFEIFEVSKGYREERCGKYFRLLWQSFSKKKIKWTAISLFQVILKVTNCQINDLTLGLPDNTQGLRILLNVRVACAVEKFRSSLDRGTKRTEHCCRKFLRFFTFSLNTNAQRISWEFFLLIYSSVDSIELDSFQTLCRTNGRLSSKLIKRNERIKRAWKRQRSW